MLGFGFQVEPVLARRRQRRSSYLQQDDGMFSVCLSVWGFLLLMQTTQSSPLTVGLLSDEG